MNPGNVLMFSKGNQSCIILGSVQNNYLNYGYFCISAYILMLPLPIFDIFIMKFGKSEYPSRSRYCNYHTAY